MEKNDKLEYWKLHQPQEPGKLFKGSIISP